MQRQWYLLTNLSQRPLQHWTFNHIQQYLLPCLHTLLYATCSWSLNMLETTARYLTCGAGPFCFFKWVRSLDGMRVPSTLMCSGKLYEELNDSFQLSVNILTLYRSSFGGYTVLSEICGYRRIRRETLCGTHDAILSLQTKETRFVYQCMRIPGRQWSL